MTPVRPGDEAAMRLALAQAVLSAQAGEIPIGAVVLDAVGTIIAEAGNTREATADPTAHAEVLALRQAGERLGRWRLDDCTLVVTMEPCPMCAGAVVMAPPTASKDSDKKCVSRASQSAIFKVRVMAWVLSHLPDPVVDRPSRWPRRPRPAAPRPRALSKSQ